MCITEKFVVPGRLYFYCEYYRRKIVSLPNFSTSPAYFNSPIIKDPRVGQVGYFPY